jgi:hypothetical protein
VAAIDAERADAERVANRYDNLLCSFIYE